MGAMPDRSCRLFLQDCAGVMFVTYSQPVVLLETEFSAKHERRKRLRGRFARLVRSDQRARRGERELLWVAWLN